MCVDISVCWPLCAGVHLCVCSCLHVAVGGKIDLRAELLNLLLKLVFDRKLISHAREEDVEV